MVKYFWRDSRSKASLIQIVEVSQGYKGVVSVLEMKYMLFKVFACSLLAVEGFVPRPLRSNSASKSDWTACLSVYKVDARTAPLSVLYAWPHACP